jgi:7-cyano-7-deazaguanine synthase in queuosine biosynthesis
VTAVGASSFLAPRRTILWTGGFDSTWLVVDSLLRGEAVRAVAWLGGSRYVLPRDKARNEAAARARIEHALPAALARRLDVEVHRDNQVDGEAMSAVWNELWGAAPGVWWSPQNAILGMLPAVLGGPVAAGLVADDPTAAQAGVLRVLREHGVELPIVERRKAELLDDARARGFDELLALTWSCEGSGPLASTTGCGECGPCRERILPAAGYWSRG